MQCSSTHANSSIITQVHIMRLQMLLLSYIIPPFIPQFPHVCWPRPNSAPPQTHFRKKLQYSQVKISTLGGMYYIKYYSGIPVDVARRHHSVRDSSPPRCPLRLPLRPRLLPGIARSAPSCVVAYYFSRRSALRSPARDRQKVSRRCVKRYESADCLAWRRIYCIRDTCSARRGRLS